MVRMIVAANVSIIVAMERKRKVKPSVSFHGSDSQKSCSWNGDVRMDRNITTAVNELARDITSVTVNTKKKGSFRKTGRPVSWSVPPGRVYAAAKATVAKRTATREHESAVRFSHFLP